MESSLSAAAVERRISLIALGVADLGAVRRFYEALGCECHQFAETVLIATGGALVHDVRAPAAVDEILAAAAAGATVTKAAGETFYGGYSASFADPDGHLREVARNPGFALAADGSLVLPDFDDSPRPRAGTRRR